MLDSQTPAPMSEIVPSPQVLLEDDDILALAKPPGMVVNQSETHSDPTIQAWLIATYPAIFRQSVADWERRQSDWISIVPPEMTDDFGSPAEIFQARLGIAHRLDKDTSGVLLVAKNPGSLAHLLRQFKLRQLTKTYAALVHGKFNLETSELSFPIGRHSRDRRHFTVRPDGRPAVTRYHVEQFFARLNWSKIIQTHPTLDTAAWRRRFSIYQGFSWLSCQPKTGRTHQLRVHLSHVQHPIVGDEIYAGKKRQVLDQHWCPRHFLHAQQITFTHPRTQTPLTLTAPLPADLQAALSYLQTD